MVLFKAYQRRATQQPPLPPITKEQISNGDLKDLLEESDYNLTAIVDLYSILVTSSIYFSPSNMYTNSFLIVSENLFQFLNAGLYYVAYILCKVQNFNAFPYE